MKHRQLKDFPEYVRVRQVVDKLRTEEGQISARLEEIRAELSKPKQRVNGQDAWSLALEGKDQPSMEIDTESSLREELNELEGRSRFITEALKTGTMELDKVHGAASLQICKEVRLQFVEQIKQLLLAIKTICETNQTLETLRADIEASGVRSDSLPHCIFEIGGPWEDPHGYGGRVSSYRKYVSEHFPELEPVRGLRRQLAEKSQSFEKNPEEV